MQRTAKTETQDQDSQSWLEMVRQQVAFLRFGVVQIAVHDSHVVQIERTEKVRLDRLTADNL